ncbi:MAG: hypothetical protein ACFFA0_11985 [Promethearchaeota archaeon]
MLQDIWILYKSGIVVFHRDYKESLSPQAFGAMMSALDTFAEHLTEGGLSNFELNNKRYTIIKKHDLIFVANSSKQYNQKKINRELEKVSNKFLKLYSKDLEGYKGKIGSFTEFEEVIEKSLEYNNNKPSGDL